MIYLTSFTKWQFSLDKPCKITYYNVLFLITGKLRMYNFKTPPEILKKIEECREKKAKVLDLNSCDNSVTYQKITLLKIPPEVFSLNHLKELNLRNHAIKTNYQT